MAPRITAAILAVVTLASAGSDAFACGDKFLRVGQSDRLRKYASIHPSAVLVYGPRWKREGIKGLERMLKGAGHKPVVTVTTAAALARALAGGPFDLVITAYADAGAVRTELNALPSRPALLPLLYKPTKAEAAAAAATYRCILAPEKMTPVHALEEIDRLIVLHSKGLDTFPEDR